MGKFDKRKKLIEWISKTVERLPIALYRKGNRKESPLKRAQLNMAEALCICCFIDALGGYIYGGGVSNSANKCNFKRFVERYMSDFYRELTNKATKEKAGKEKYLDQFYEEVRCGLVHKYFPEQRKRSKGSYIQSKEGKTIVSGRPSELIIRLPNLRESFKRAFMIAKQDIPRIF